MKIEAGKYYRSRGGSKCYIAAELPFSLNEGERLIGTEDGTLDSWMEDGLYYGSGTESGSDLIEEWKEEEFVPLEAKDIVPGTVFRSNMSSEENFASLLRVDQDGIYIGKKEDIVTYPELMEGFRMMLPGSTEWVPCHKKAGC